MLSAFGRFFGAAGGGPLPPLSVKTRPQTHPNILSITLREEGEGEPPISPLSPLSPPPITRGTSSSSSRLEGNNNPKNTQSSVPVSGHNNNNNNNNNNNTSDHVRNNAPINGNTNGSNSGNSSSSSSSNSNDVFSKISSFFTQIVSSQSNLSTTVHTNPLAPQSNGPVKNDSVILGHGILQEQNRYNHKTKKWETGGIR